MCTLIVRVPEVTSEMVYVLAVRDEDPGRPWQPIGHHWPDRPEMIGVRDQLAGGAWLAAHPQRRRLAAIVNLPAASQVPNPTSRGQLALDAASGQPVPATPTTLGFHLLTVDHATASVVTWDGATRSEQALAPGTHLITHAPVDDPADARTGAWLPQFASAVLRGERWWEAWAAVLTRSAELPNTDDRAIIRDNRPHGYPTLTLMAAFLALGPAGFTVRHIVLEEPGCWLASALWKQVA